MTRTTLVNQIISKLEDMPTVEQDCFEFSQTFWTESGNFWSSYYSKDLENCRDILEKGQWCDASLHRFNHQLEKFGDLFLWGNK